MFSENGSYRGVCGFCGQTVEVLDDGRLGEHLDGVASCAGVGVPLLAQYEGAPMPSLETVLHDDENKVLLMVERERDPMRLRLIAGALNTGNANAASLHRDQVRELVSYLDDVTQAVRAVAIGAVINAMHGAETASVDWVREIPRGAEEFGDLTDERVGIDLVDEPVVRFALFVHDLGVAGPRRIGLVMSVDQARGLRDDLRRSLAWMDAIAGFDTMGDVA